MSASEGRGLHERTVTVSTGRVAVSASGGRRHRGVRREGRLVYGRRFTVATGEGLFSASEGRGVRESRCPRCPRGSRSSRANGHCIPQSCTHSALYGKGRIGSQPSSIFNGTVTRSTTSRVRLACSTCRLCSMVGRGNDVRSSFEIFNGTVTRSTTSRVRSTTSRVRLACSMLFDCSICRLCSMVGRSRLVER